MYQKQGHFDSIFSRYICQPLIRQDICQEKGKFLHLKNLRLANSNIQNECLPVDILLGSESEIICGESRTSVAIKAKFSHVLSWASCERSEFVKFYKPLHLFSKITGLLFLKNSVLKSLRKYLDSFTSSFSKKTS